MFRHGLLRNTVQSAHMKRYTNSRDFTRENPFQGDQDYKNQLLLVNLFWSYKWQLHKKAREAVQKTFWKSVLLQERFGNTLEMGRRKKKKKITCTLVTFSHILHADFNQENQKSCSKDLLEKCSSARKRLGNLNWKSVEDKIVTSQRTW